MLDATNMTNQFNDLISVTNATTGTMTLLNGAKDMDINLEIRRIIHNYYPP